MGRNDYWFKREQKWIKQQLQDDALINKKIELQLNRALVNIQKDIANYYAAYAKNQDISLADAMTKVKQFDVKAFEATAKQMVENKDFSALANERLKLYNATMRINQLEYLKSQVGMELVDANSNIEKIMGDKLTSAYQDEVKRQAGILNKHRLNDVKGAVNSVVNASFQGATWSQRIWANNDNLKSRLEQLLTRSMVQGVNPKVLARDLSDQFKKEFNNSRYMAERLMRTETARVQDEAQRRSFEKNGIEYVVWVNEPDACENCIDIANANDGIYPLNKVPGIPVHANCRCSKAAYVPKKAEEAKLEGLDTTGMFSKDIEDALNQLQPNGADEFYKLLNKSPENIKQMFYQNRDIFKFKISDGISGAHYVPSSKIIMMGTNQGMVDSGVQIAFHEMTHAIDNVNRKIESFTYDRVLKRSTQKLDYRRFAGISDGGNWGLKESIDKELAPVLKRLSTEYGDGSDFYQMVNTREWREKFIGNNEKNWSKWADYSDIVQAGTNGKINLGQGHIDGYWYNSSRGTNEKGKDFAISIPSGMQQQEFFAELTAALTSNPESLKMFKELFPETIKIYNKIVGSIIGG